MTANSQRKAPKGQLVASAPYVPTAEDARAVEAFQARQEQVPANVNLKLIRHEEHGPAFSVDYPDQGTGRVHLMTALGVTDTQLCNKLLMDIGNLAVCQGKHASEADLNDMLSVVRGIGPTDAVEAMLAVQMAAVHQASIQCARRLAQAVTLEQEASASSTFNKLMRTFAAQLEALKRHRSAGEQNVVVKHVHVYPGGQAVVGNVNTGGRGADKSERQPHEPRDAAEQAGTHAAGTKVLSHVEADRDDLSRPSGKGKAGLSRARGTRRRS